MSTDAIQATKILLRRALRRVRRTLSPPDPSFTIEDFQRREKHRADYEWVASSLIRHVPFESAYDVGCANALLLEPLHRAGKTVRGIELSKDVKAVLSPDVARLVDIGDFAKARGTWDLVCCVEVAEHIQPERSAELVRTLVELAQHFTYFTAAPPGQPGQGHINCRPHEEWNDLFVEAGWECDMERTEALRHDLENLTTAVWLRSNSYILKKA